jgi:hypothetical protein
MKKRIRTIRNRILFFMDSNINTINCVLFGILILLLMLIFLDTANTDNAIKCKNIKGEYCTEYEIEKMVKNGQ